MTKYPDLFAALAAPFEPQEVKVRSQANRQLHYITARTAMNRLDAVLGPENWWDEYIPSQNSVLCKLSIRLPDGQVLTKADAGGYAGMSDQGDDDKSGYSDAFKRAAVKLGVARYLYRDGVPEFVREREPNVEKAMPTSEHVDNAPSPAPSRSRPGIDEPSTASSSTRTATSTAPPPRSGRAMFAWVKDQEQRHGVNLLKYLNNWGKLQEYPSRMIDWDAEQVAMAYSEAIRKLQSIHPASEEALEEALSN
ncbi:hypothetical protein BH23PLA1_BH23PLA1_20260 [soil metagenome]